MANNINESSAVTYPASALVAAAKSDTTNQPAGTSRGIVFGGAGAIKIRCYDDTDVTLPSGVLSAGVIHPIQVKRVWNTGTAATDIWLVY